MGSKNIRSKFKRLQWRGSFHRRSFILILLIASIPGLITGLGIYWFAVGNVEKELRTLHDSQISQRAKNIDEQFNYLEYSASHWAFDPRFGSILRDIDFVKQFRETYEITKLLLLLQGSHSLIKDVELYIETEQPVLFNSEYNILNDETKEIYQNWLKVDKNIHWDHYMEQNNNTTNLVLVCNIPATSKDPFGSIIVTIDNNKALQLLKTLTPYNKGATFILNSENEVLLSSNSTKNPEFVSVLKNEILKHKGNKGSFQTKFNDTMYSVSYGHFTRIDTNWTYVSAAPMSSITAPLVFVSKLILIISISALILAFIMSWFASNRIYSPIGTLVRKLMEDDSEKWERKSQDEFQMIEQQWQNLSEKSDLLQNRLSEQVPHIKNSFILQLIQGYLYHYNEEDLRKRMESYGWNVNEHSFIALDIQLTGSYDSNNDESLLSFVAANLIEEIAQKTFDQFNVINFPDLSVGMLIVYPSHTTIRDDIHQFANEVAEAVNQGIQMQVTVTISESTESIKKISYLFEELSTGKRFRIFDNKNQVIDLNEIDHAESFNEIHYPFAIEKEVIQAIRMGQVDEVEMLIKQFSEELTLKGINEMNIQHGVSQLYSSIQHEILHSGIHPFELFDGRNMLEELSQIRDIDGIMRWFTEEVISPYIHKLEGRMNIELKRIIEKVVKKIHDHYMDDISLESCADEVGSNPYTLSKSFKHIIGINFIDYLTQLRIDKAKELLLNTDLKINDIAETVGYRHSYFNRIFKKQIGVPPSQYRKLNQAKTQKM